MPQFITIHQGRRQSMIGVHWQAPAKLREMFAMTHRSEECCPSAAKRIRVLALAIAPIALIALGGCAKHEAASGGTGAASPEQQARGPGQPSRQNDTLAYEHTVSVELSKDSLPTRLREVEAACVGDQTSGCTILEVSLRLEHDLPSGSVRMRLAPGGVDSMIERASRGGKLVGRITQAEDLAQPVADTQRELASLTVHRDRLAEFMKSKELKVEQLITVSKELASVQAQLDAASTRQANLRRRIDTDLLTINLSLPLRSYADVRTPVRDAWNDFGRQFREAVGQVIYFLAVLLPWLTIIIPGLILVRWFWRSISRWLARREQA